MTDGQWLYLILMEDARRPGQDRTTYRVARKEPGG